MPEPKDISSDPIGDKARALIFALKQSYDQGDDTGVVSAYKQLTALLTHKFKGSKLPAPEWDNFVPAGRFYSLLDIKPLSSSRQVHVGFLRAIRSLLLDRKHGRVAQDRDFLTRIEELCLAHDVLREPQTRVDYDFRLLKVRGGGNSLADELNALDQSEVQGRVHLKIGELLQSSEIIDTIELAAAVDMHKAVPEMLFGQFMVKSGFINQSELDTVLAAQKLIGEGKITVAQFQQAMKAFKEDGISLDAFLKQEGWLEE